MTSTASCHQGARVSVMSSIFLLTNIEQINKMSVWGEKSTTAPMMHLGRKQSKGEWRSNITVWVDFSYYGNKWPWVDCSSDSPTPPRWRRLLLISIHGGVWTEAATPPHRAEINKKYNSYILARANQYFNNKIGFSDYRTAAGNYCRR